MKKTRLMAVAMTAVLTLGMMTGCGQKATAPETQAATEAAATEVAAGETETEGAGAEAVDSADGVIKTTDMKGREVVLEKPAEKVIALNPADCEILYALGAQDLLVGRGEYCDYPAEVVDIQAVQSGAEINIEQILALEPDVMLMSEMAQTVEQVAQLEEAGIAVVVSESSDIAGVYESIKVIGTIVGKDEEAAKLIQDMQAGFEELISQVPADADKKIYFEISPLQYGLWTAGMNTFMDEVATMLGATNCFGDVDGWAAISEEQVLERNPEYIVTTAMYYGEGAQPDEEILAREGWENVDAVANGKVMSMVDNSLTRPGPRLVDGAKHVFELLYSE